MEYYRSTCLNPACQKTYTWVGFKTGIGKTQEQLEQMHRDETVCRYCGKETLETGLDHETPYSRSLDAALGNIVGAMASGRPVMIGSPVAKAGSGGASSDKESTEDRYATILLKEWDDMVARVKKAEGQGVECSLRAEAAEHLVRKVRVLNEAKAHAWTWLGDGSDDLSSMGDEMAVVIMAGDLRTLLHAHVEKAEARRLKVVDMVQAILDYATKDVPK